MSILALSKGLGLLLGGKGFARRVGDAKTGKRGDVGELLPVENGSHRGGEVECQLGPLDNTSAARNSSSTGCPSTVRR